MNITKQTAVYLNVKMLTNTTECHHQPRGENILFFANVSAYRCQFITSVFTLFFFQNTRHVSNITTTRHCYLHMKIFCFKGPVKMHLFLKEKNWLPNLADANRCILHWRTYSSLNKVHDNQIRKAHI